MGTVDEQSRITKPLEQIGTQVEFILQQRSATGRFEVALDGVSEPGKSSLAREYEPAGATGWFEAIHLSQAPVEQLLERIQAGPPA